MRIKDELLFTSTLIERAEFPEEFQKGLDETPPWRDCPKREDRSESS